MQFEIQTRFTHHLVLKKKTRIFIVFQHAINEFNLVKKLRKKND